MERYYKKQCLNPSPNIPGSPPPPSNIPSSRPSSIPGSAQQREVAELDEILANFPTDPGLRRRMLDYPLNCCEAIRRYYLQNEPCEPKSHIMPRKASYNQCFITIHEGSVGSLHNKAMQQAKDLMTQKQHIEHFSLEDAIERLFATTNLSLSKLWGQGYDGASNMKALVFVAKENEDVANFFINASSLVNLIELSCKRCDAFREKQQEQIQKALDLGNLETVVVEMVEWIKSDRNQDNLGEATRKINCECDGISGSMQAKTTILFGDLFHDVERFCEEHDIIIFNMEDLHFVPIKSRRKVPKITNFNYYRVDLYFQVLDMQLKELNDRFNEVNTELLLCMACLSPVNNFASFDKAKIVHLAQLYPQDFDRMNLMNLSIQLDNYIHDMKMHSEFSSLREISDLVKELVKDGRIHTPDNTPMAAGDQNPATPPGAR
ncbi:unnamed protein product [Malus baccata var. baccata]